ncbi:MAG: catalase-peroxidase, partial [Solirubrobacterales bacterium]|nr:catalase-peroxidase [Solirubrobacterales bacterium]
KAAADAGHSVSVPVQLGRVDATPAQTDVESFAALEPRADGFRNYVSPNETLAAEYLLIDKANLLTLTAPETTVLVGGLRVLETNWDGSAHGVLTDRPGQLTNDFFVNLLDLNTEWTGSGDLFQGTGPAGQKWTGTRADLVFGSNSELRALAEVYASDDAAGKFAADFAAAFSKVLHLDRFDL